MPCDKASDGWPDTVAGWGVRVQKEPKRGHPGEPCDYIGKVVCLFICAWMACRMPHLPQVALSIWFFAVSQWPGRTVSPQAACGHTRQGWAWRPARTLLGAVLELTKGLDRLLIFFIFFHSCITYIMTMIPDECIHFFVFLKYLFFTYLFINFYFMCTFVRVRMSDPLELGL